MLTQLSTAEIVAYYQLQPHPEGGYYKETYRSKEQIDVDALPARFNGNRHFSTAIYFLLESGNFSAFHRIQSDETWHFYAGQLLHVFVIHENGELETIQLGPDLMKGQTFQTTVPAGAWFASKPADGTEFSFVGCTVAPGFDFIDFELAIAFQLKESYPQHADLIEKLCRV
jgi:predicted cupin superfamily sugar epimerase